MNVPIVTGKPQLHRQIPTTLSKLQGFKMPLCRMEVKVGLSLPPVVCCASGSVSQLLMLSFLVRFHGC